MIQHISKQSFSFNDYLNRSYVSRLQASNLSPEVRTALNLIASRSLGSQGGFHLAQRLVGLDPLGKKIHLYSARDYMPSLLTRDNVILIGSRIGNPWVELFDSHLNFTTKYDIDHPDGPISIVNRSPMPGEKVLYTPSGSNVYCVVAYLPNPEHHGKVILVEGTGSEAIEAAGDFLLSDDQLSNFQKILHVTKLPYFEVLLKVSTVRDTPLTATILGYRIYQNQR